MNSRKRHANLITSVKITNCLNIASSFSIKWIFEQQLRKRNTILVYQIHYPISCQWSLSIPLENNWKHLGFFIFSRGYRKRPMAWNGFLSQAPILTSSSSNHFWTSRQYNAFPWFFWQHTCKILEVVTLRCFVKKVFLKILDWGLQLC